MRETLIPLALQLLTFVSGLITRPIEVLGGWMTELWNGANLEEQNREENFLRRLFTIRRDWMNNPVRLGQELNKLFQLYRTVPSGITRDMELPTMIAILETRTGHRGGLDANRQALSLTETSTR